MELHALKNSRGARKKRKRVGRGMGSGIGKTCGRGHKGHKGQKARKGYSEKLGFEGGQMSLLRRLPKRGFNSPCRRSYQAVNVGAVDARFEDGAEVDVTAMRSAGLVAKGKVWVKVLGCGDVTKKINVTADAFSAGARNKIEAAGGSCRVTGE